VKSRKLPGNSSIIPNSKPKAQQKKLSAKFKKLLNISMNYSVYKGLLIEKIELIEYFYNLEFWDSRGTWEDRFKII